MTLKLQNLFAQCVIIGATASPPPPPPPAIVYDDTFGGTAGTLITAHTPDIAPVGFTYVLTAGRYVLTGSNGMQWDTATQPAIFPFVDATFATPIDVSTTGFSLEVKLEWPVISAGTRAFQLVAISADNNNWIAISGQADTSNPLVLLANATSNFTTDDDTLDLGDTYTPVYVAGQIYSFKYTLTPANVFTLFQDGVQIDTATGSGVTSGLCTDVAKITIDMAGANNNPPPIIIHEVIFTTL